jgi:diketogulonate reductase-like aldo/keto reductase
MTHKTLSNGILIPTLGFGTYLLQPGEETRTAVEQAIKSGYRHIDTAESYDNEASVGYAIGKVISSGAVTRKDLFITTKISAHNPIGYDNTLYAFDGSMHRLGLDYLDLYLIHWPNMTSDDSWKQLNSDTWRAFEKLYNDGRIKAIGVSNFLIHHLEVLAETAVVMPMVNQIELNPQWQQREVVDYCHQKGIICEAWMPLVKGFQPYYTAEKTHGVVSQIASECNRTMAQVCLRWSIQKGFVPLVKTKTPERMIENQRVFDFELLPHQIAALDHLNGTLSTHDATPDSIRYIWSLYEKIWALEAKLRGNTVETIYKCHGLLSILRIRRANEQWRSDTYYLFKFLPLFKKISDKKGTVLYFLKFLPVRRSRSRWNGFEIRRFLPPPPPQKEVLDDINDQKTSFEHRVFEHAIEFDKARTVLPNRFKYKPRLQNFLLKTHFCLTNKIVIPHLDVCITTRCTLKCSDCSHSNPYFTRDAQYDTSLSDFKLDLDKVLKGVDKLYALNILGGETLLHPELPAMIEYAVSKPQIMNIVIFTNGTLLPSKKLLTAAQLKKNVVVHISDYTGNCALRDRVRIKELQQIFYKNNVNYYIESFAVWGLTPRIIEAGKKNNNTKDLANTFCKCRHNYCPILWRGTIYPCAQSKFIHTLPDYYLTKDDFIDLHKSIDIRKDFINFYKRHFYDVCGYCTINTLDNHVFPAIQL